MDWLDAYENETERAWRFLSTRFLSRVFVYRGQHSCYSTPKFAHYGIIRRLPSSIRVSRKSVVDFSKSS